MIPPNLPSAAEMRAFDRAAIEAGVPSIELMERAGKEVFKKIRSSYFPEKKPRGKLLILCGPGNNGGDGLVIARFAAGEGMKISVVITAAEKYSSDFMSEFSNLQMSVPDRADSVKVFMPAGMGYSEAGIRAELKGEYKINALEDFSLQEVSLIVDALLGTGSASRPRKAVGALLKKISGRLKEIKNPPPVVAVDCPTGINCDTGEVYFPVLYADLTVAIELVKRGMLQYPAADVCGSIETVSIGLSVDRPCRFLVLSERDVKPLPSRRPDAHKGDFGHVFVIGGSRDMPGAPLLSALAALRCGAGLVSMAKLRSLREKIEVPEIMFCDVPDKEGIFTHESYSYLEKLVKKASCIVIGPGLGRADETGAFVETLLKRLSKLETPVVIDADALNLIGQMEGGLSGVMLKNAVFTPHPGEMGRLLGIPPSEVQKDRYSAVERACALSDNVFILKGARTIISTQETGYVNLTGNPYMATAGSGDVLCGVIAALAAQGYSILDAALSGVYLHGKAGDAAGKKRKGPLIASDIIDALSVGNEQ